jgi:hypothetical protein
MRLDTEYRSNVIHMPRVFWRLREPETTIRPNCMKDARLMFARWLKSAYRGDTYVYHTGDLAFDRLNSHGLHWLAIDVMGECIDGNVILSQRKIAPFKYEYRATYL